MNVKSERRVKDLSSEKRKRENEQITKLETKVQNGWVNRWWWTVHWPSWTWVVKEDDFFKREWENKQQKWIGNRIGRDGAESLSVSLKINPTLTDLNLEGDYQWMMRRIQSMQWGMNKNEQETVLKMKQSKQSVVHLGQTQHWLNWILVVERRQE